GDPVAGPDWHGALVHDNDRSANRFGHGLDSAADLRHVGLTLLSGGRVDSDKDELSTLAGEGIVGGEAQASGFAIAIDEITQAGLEDWQDATIKARYSSLVDIQAGNGISKIGEAGPGDESYVSRANDSYVRQPSPPVSTQCVVTAHLSGEG